ncbi:MAG: CopG family antitoxin [Pseudomonadota bacterium]
MMASEFDKKFDTGEDITGYLDLKSTSRPNLEQKRVNVDFPVWMVEKIDKEASRIGITRQSLIKLWLADKLAH